MTCAESKVAKAQKKIKSEIILCNDTSEGRTR